MRLLPSGRSVGIGDARKNAARDEHVYQPQHPNEAFRLTAPAPAASRHLPPVLRAFPLVRSATGSILTRFHKAFGRLFVALSFPRRTLRLRSDARQAHSTPRDRE